jgi:ABC-type uncharacterized transport system permease subunit
VGVNRPPVLLQAILAAMLGVALVMGAATLVFAVVVLPELDWTRFYVGLLVVCLAGGALSLVWAWVSLHRYLNQPGP